NFRTDMPEAVDRLLAGVLSSDFESVAPYVVGSEIDGNIQNAFPPIHAFDLSGPGEPKRPADALLLFPNVGYKQQIGTLLFTHIYGRLGGGLKLVTSMRLWIKGQYGEFTVPDSQQGRFYDPDTGFTYVARQQGEEMVDGKLVEKGIGARMLR